MKTSLALLVAAVGLGTVGCGAPVDPTGNWGLTLAWGAGDCGLTKPSLTLTVTQASNGYVLASSDPKDTVTGTITCTTETCKMSATVGSQETATTQEGESVTINATASFNLTVDVENKITGSGSVSATGSNGASCSQVFTATGTKN